MRLSSILPLLDEIAPLTLAEGWDKVGLQVGAPRQEISRGLLCIDLTPGVLAEAKRLGVELIMAYHPPIFAPVGKLTEEHWKARMLVEVIRRKMAIYSPHTALDAALGGTNDWLCDGLVGVGGGRRRAIKPVSGDSRECKVVTYVPAEAADRLRNALAAAGAGRIGAYSHCSFNLAGEGTFLAQAGANPVVGGKGRLERVQEMRLEMICPLEKLGAVMAALRENHPYEEPGVDVLPLLNLPREHEGSLRAGQGRIVELDQPVSAAELGRRVAQRLKLKSVQVVEPGAQGKKIGTLGVCVGAGGGLLMGALDQVDALVTGEMRHHDVLEARESGKTVVLTGHTESERPYLREYRRLLEKKCGGGIRWQVSKADR